MEQTVYKLKSKRKGIFELPIEGINIERKVNGENVGARSIKYIPGAKSFWADDLDKNLKSEKVWFINGFLFVPKSDKNLTEIAKRHPFLGRHYLLHDKEADAKRQLEEEKAKDEIINMISGSDKARIIATSMAIFGQSSLTLTESELELKLRQYAKSSPIKLKNELSSKTYESKYISALAFGKGVVRTNFGKTSIIWNDQTEGEILKLARGESGIEKLGELLSKRTDESETLLHAIGSKLDQKSINTSKKESVISEKDKQIAELKKQLEEANNKNKIELNQELTSLRGEYKNKFKKDVPLRFKNDTEWMKNKLSE